MEDLAKSYTTSGHLVGMLDRDQRTTCSKSSRSSDQVRNQGDLTYEPRLIKIKTSSANDSCRAKRYSRVHWNAQRLNQFLVVVLHLLIVTPNVLSAPSGSNMANLKGLNKEIYDQCILNLNQAEEHYESYTNYIFSMNSESAYERFKNYTTLPWLPTTQRIPQDFGTDDETDSFNRNYPEELGNIYSQLIKIRNELNRIVDESPIENTNQEEEKYHAIFKSISKQSENFLHLLGMLPELPTNADDIIINNKANEEDEAEKRKRNWGVYTAYINTLKYASKVVEKSSGF